MNALAGLANYSDDDEDNELKQEEEEHQPQKEIKKEKFIEGTRKSETQSKQSPLIYKTHNPLTSIKQKEQKPVTTEFKKEENPRINDPPAAIRQHLNATDKARRRKILLTPKPVEGVDNWGIPGEPDTPCDIDRLEKTAHFLSLRASGHRLNDHLQRNKAFRNPRIYAKLVEFIDLDETGSNFPKEEFDPHGFAKEDYIDGILEQQKKHAEEKIQAQQNRTNISFVQQQQKPSSAPPKQTSSQPAQPSPQQSAVMAAALANVAKVKSRLEQQQKRSSSNSSSSSSSHWDSRERKRVHRE
ncbi:HCNGP-like protein-domain-containing protein [Circinella umbellata]|nr:HCNGP-like protein-domain-containing protein [Circinella umbellata]